MFNEPKIPAMTVCVIVLLLHMTIPYGTVAAENQESNHLLKSQPENFSVTHPFQHKLRPPQLKTSEPTEASTTYYAQRVHVSREQVHMWKVTMDRPEAVGDRADGGALEPAKEVGMIPSVDMIIASTAPSKPNDEDNKMSVQPTNESPSPTEKVNEGKAISMPGCPSCMVNAALESALSAKEIRQMRLDMIKEQILRKLGLSEPPNTDFIPKEPIPLPIAQGNTLPKRRHPYMKNRNRDVDDFYGKTEQVIIFPEDVFPECVPHVTGPSSCFTFKMPQEKPTEEISSSELWFYKLPDHYHGSNNQTFWVDEISSVQEHVGSDDYVTVTNIAIKDEVTLGEGWIKMNLSGTVPRWMGKNGSSSAVVQIGCSRCNLSNEESPIDTAGEQRPFIVINFKSVTQRRRSRRSLTCSPSLSECCRESFVVNFREIGWDSWIIGPASYNAYYCKGSCITINSASHSRWHHTAVMQKYIRTFGITNKTAEIIPCCTASKMSAISLVYRDPSNLNTTMKKEILPNMVVDSCSCQ